MVEAFILNSVRAAPSVSDEPEAKAYSWTIYRIDTIDGKGTEDHLVCSLTPRSIGGKGRVTSAIQSFNKDTKTITTRSGRQYELVGEPGFDGDADYVWGVWKRRNAVTGTEINVSMSYYD